MIDPHVHMRDWEQTSKETLKHGLDVAYRAGLDGIFEMPNTDPPLTSKRIIMERIQLGNMAISELGKKIFHGIFAGLTADVEQIKEVAALAMEEKRVIGLKLYAGHSTGNMGIIKEEEQKLVFKTLAEAGYTGVVGIHCEKESIMEIAKWDSSVPFSHTLARPPSAEIASLKDMISFARGAGFNGTLHICHITLPESVQLVNEAKNDGMKIVSGLTPHHAMLYAEQMKEDDGMLKKMNPPLRSKETAEKMVELLIEGKIDWIETDHAPHTLEDKEKKHASGVPCLHAHPLFVELLRSKGMSPERIDEITHDNILKVFELDIPNTKRKAQDGLGKEYEYDVFKTS